jgi:hypothetical protein
MRRRLVFVFVAVLSLSLTSCLSRAAWDDAGSPGRRPRNAPAPAPCREIARVHCDTERCSGANMDWVDLMCGSQRTSRCVIAKGCGAGD